MAPERTVSGDSRSKAIAETSVLINYLKINRTDLLARHPKYRFVVPDLVREEVKKHYATQVSRLDAALAAGHLVADDPPEKISPAELVDFAAMETLKIGVGERAALAAAKTRGLPLAMDDQRAWKRAEAFCAGIARENTVSVMVSLIQAGVIDVAEADAIKADWEAKHRFRLKHFASFGELI